jgi:hypothetical protein
VGDECLDESVEGIEMLAQDRARTFFSFAQELGDFLVDDPLCLLCVAPAPDLFGSEAS